MRKTSGQSGLHGRSPECDGRRGTGFGKHDAFQHPEFGLAPGGGCPVSRFVTELDRRQAIRGLARIDAWLLGRIAVDGQELVTSRPLPSDDAGKERGLALRPEAILVEPPSNDRNSLAATVEEISFLGSVVRIRARVSSAIVTLDVFNDPNRILPERGQPVALGFSHDNLLVLDENVH